MAAKDDELKGKGKEDVPPIDVDAIEAEVAKVKDFFEDIPEHLRPWAAERFCFECAVFGSRSRYEALGILTEALHTYRDASEDVMAEELEELEEEMDDEDDNTPLSADEEDDD